MQCVKEGKVYLSYDTIVKINDNHSKIFFLFVGFSYKYTLTPPNRPSTVESSLQVFTHIPFPNYSLLLILILIPLRNIQTQAFRVQVQLILPTTLLQNLRNRSGVLNSLQVDIGARLLDGVSDQFGGSCFSLGADDHGLFLLSGFVDYEGGALGFLLGYLFGFDGGCEFG